MASSNVELLRDLYVSWGRGDFSSVNWAHPEIEFAIADGPEPGAWNGVSGMVHGWNTFASAWDDFRVEPTDYIELDDERVLVLVQFGGQAKASGLELGQMQTKNASVAQFRDGKVTRLVLYWDRDRALADLGLSGDDAARLGLPA